MRLAIKKSIRLYLTDTAVHAPLCFAILVLLVSFVLSANVAKAQGNLLVNPRRVVFEGSKRLIELNLANTGKDTATYAISLINIRMTKEGGFDIITAPDSGQSFANDYLRFFPKRVVLAPNEAQTVKVQLIQYNKLLPGEYRSHLYFRAIPDEQPLENRKDTAEKETSISVKINAIFGISIPVIIRIGEPNLKLTLSDLSFNSVNDTTKVLNMAFNREGSMSAYGNLSVDYISPKGTVINVAEAKGMAIYTPNTTRLFAVKLIKQPGVDYKKGKLHIKFSPDIKLEKPCEAELELN